MSNDGDDFDRESIVVSQLWRFTSAPTTALGLHSSVLIGVLALLPAAWLGIFKPVLLLAIGYAAFAAFLNMKWKITPSTWLKIQITKHVKGNRWRVR